MSSRQMDRSRRSPSQAPEELQVLLRAENRDALVENTLRYADMEEILALYPYHFELLEQPTMLIQLANRFGLLPVQGGQEGQGEEVPIKDFEDLLRAYDKVHISVRSYKYNNRSTAEILQEACFLGDLEAVKEGLRLAEMFLQEPRTRFNYREALDGALLGAAEGGHLDLVKFLKTLKPPHPLPALVAATQARHPDVRNWLLTWIETDPQVKKLDADGYFLLMRAALASGQGTLYDKLRQKQVQMGPVFANSRAVALLLQEAVRQGLIDVFEDLKHLGSGRLINNTELIKSFFPAAIEGGHLPMFLHLEELYGEHLHDSLAKCLKLATREGATDILSHLISFAGPNSPLLEVQENFEKAMYLVLFHAQVPVNWKEYDFKVVIEAAVLAAEEGHLRLLEQLLSFPMNYDTLLDVAVRKGQLKVVKFLTAAFPKELTSSGVFDTLDGLITHMAYTRRERAQQAQWKSILVWLLQEMGLEKIKMDVPLPFSIVVNMPIWNNDAELLEFLLVHKDSSNFDVPEDFGVMLEAEEINEGIIEVLLDYESGKYLIEDPLSAVAGYDNLPAVLYLLERGYKYVPIELLSQVLGEASTSKVVDYLFDRGLTDEELVAGIREASEVFRYVVAARRELILYFLPRAFKEASRHPLPILKEIATIGEMKLMKLLLSYPGYDQIDAFLWWMEMNRREKKEIKDWFRQLDLEELLVRIFEDRLPQPEEDKTWFYKSMESYAPDIHKRLDILVQDYLRTNDPKLEAVLHFKGALAYENDTPEFLDYCDELLKQANTEEDVEIIRRQWLVNGNKLAERLYGRRRSAGAGYFDPRELALEKRLLEGGVDIKRLPVSGNDQRFTMGMLELRKKYDPSWNNLVDILLSKPTETELSKNLILLGVDPQRIIKHAVEQGRIKLLKDLVGEGVIEDSWVDWELARANVWASWNSGARTGTDVQYGPYSRPNQRS